jgi:DNA-directed RNA polymerase subunit RPC12/RpoP
MLSENGKSKPKKKYGQKIKCPYCGAKLILEELQEEENVIKMANVTICTCSKCFEEFNI